MFSFFLRLPARWPHTVMGVMVLVWIALALISAPFFDLTYATRGLGAFIISGYVGVFMLGSWSVSAIGGHSRAQSRAHRPASAREVDYTPLFVALMLIAMLGVALRLFDHLVVRGADVAISEIARRKLDVSVAANQSLLGLVAAPLVAFCYFPVLIMTIQRRKLPRVARFSAYALAAFPAFEAFFFQGGASGAAYALVTLLSIYSLRDPTEQPGFRFKFHGRQKVLFGAGLALSIVLAAALYQARITTMTGWSVSTYLLYLQTSSSNVIIPSTLLLNLVDTPIIGSIFMGVYWFCLYVTSGVYTLIYVIEVPPIIHTQGGTQAQILVRVFDMLTLNNSRPPIIDANPMAGFYQTIFGDIYIDFGVVGGLVQCLLMGVVAALVHRARLMGSFYAQILDPVLKTFIIMGIFVSSFSSFGSFILLAAIATIGLSAFMPRRRLSAPAIRSGRSTWRPS